MTAVSPGEGAAGVHRATRVPGWLKGYKTMESPKKTLEGKYGYFRLVLGMTAELVKQWPEDKLDFRPVPEVRSAQEILGHMYAFLLEGALTVKEGRHQKQTEPKLGSKAEVLAFMNQQVQRFYETWDEITDADLLRVVEAYGTKFPAWEFLGFVYDEHWHHRGQLTVYLRMCGVEPLMIYDYDRLKG